MKRKPERMTRGRVIAAVLTLFIMTGLFLGGCGASGKTVNETLWDTVFLGELTLRGEFREFRDTVQPDNPSGLYDIYDKYEGYRYYVVAGVAENSSSQALRSNSFYVEGETDGRRREGKILFLNEQSSQFEDKIEAETSRPFVLFMLLENDENPEAFRIFYNEGYETVEKTSQYDHEVNVAVDPQGELQ